ncbi:MAG: hypothetical protein OXT09_18745, partial [Myxococcales bacterium]|nr:hypothetical protein [Myxococcales bacterium]
MRNASLFVLAAALVGCSEGSTATRMDPVATVVTPPAGADMSAAGSQFGNVPPADQTPTTPGAP